MCILILIVVYDVNILLIVLTTQRDDFDKVYTVCRSSRKYPIFLILSFSLPICLLEITRSASFDTCQQLELPTKCVTSTQGRVHLASGKVNFWMEFPPFLMKQLYRCCSVVTASFVGTWYTMRR